MPNKNKVQTSDTKKLQQNAVSLKTKSANNKDTQSTKPVIQTPEFSIMGFAKKMGNFYYGPPSDNFWTIDIRLHPRGDEGNEKPNLSLLYRNIIEANRGYDVNHVTSNWNVGFKASVDDNRKASYIAGFEGSSGLFLAQSVNFRPYALTINENSFSSGQASGGFLTFGKIAQSKSGGNECNISFLISNWDICDVLIDPWIAAIAKWGLIESSEIRNLKADIFVHEYSTSVDKNIHPDENYNCESLVHRKTYKFFKAFPTNRGEVSKSYEFNQAGTFKTSTVNFKFDEYSIEYHI